MTPKVYEKPEAEAIIIQPLRSLCQSRGAEKFGRRKIVDEGGWDDWDQEYNN